MAPSIQMSIPQPFSWLLPGQGLIAGVIIYSTIYVFGVGKIPFILAVVAAGLHFILGLFFCFTKNRLRTHDVYLVPLWLVVCTGVWTGSLYYFARLLEAIIRLGGAFRAGTTGQPEIATWTKVGTALNGLNVFIDLVLIAIFIRAAVRSSQPRAVANSPYPAVAPISQQYQPSQQQQYQPQPQPQYYQVPVVQQQQHAVPQRIISTTSSDFKSHIPSTISPATSPSPSQQYQQPFQPQPHGYVEYQQHQYQQPSPNRIETLRRLCTLQSPPGSWTYTPELASLLQPWTTTQQIPTTTNPREATALTHSTMQDLCNYIWAAQHEGREHSALSLAELASLHGLGVGGDLSWAGMALDRAGGWLRGQGVGQGQNQGGYR